MRLQPRPIASETQLLVEGRDSEGFFEAMTEHLKLQDVQVQNFGGVPDLRKFLHTFVRLSDFSQVTNIGIVRDAEGSAPSAFKSVQGALEHAGLPVPERTGERQGGHPGVTVMILPDSNRSGMLETLLWDTIQDDEVRGCIDAFFECCRGTPGPRQCTDRTRLAHGRSWRQSAMLICRSATQPNGDIGT